MLKQCFICSDESRCTEVKRLLREGRALAEIGRLVGCSKSAVGRHASHHEERDQAGDSSQTRLYKRVERQLARAEKRRDWKMAERLVSRLAALQKSQPAETSTRSARAAKPTSKPGFCPCGRPYGIIRIVSDDTWQNNFRDGLRRMPRTAAAEREVMEILEAEFPEESDDEKKHSEHDQASNSELTGAAEEKN
jgi:hypothetical protein